MTPELRAELFAAALFPALLLALEIGWLWGRRVLSRTGPRLEQGLATIQTAVFGLLSLLLAFSFGAGQTRLEARRAQIILEYNAIGTVYQRIDMLPTAEQPAMRELLRRYLDARLRVYEDIMHREATDKELAECAAISRDIWRSAVKACAKSPWPATSFLFLPGVNAMVDTTTARTVALEARTPVLVLLLLWFVAVVSSLLGGFAMSVNPERSWPHLVIYGLIVSLTFYVIQDLDSPRFGFIRLTAEQHMLIALRKTMQ
jgi:hypothetical protein